MSLICSEIIDIMEKFAPLELAENWDNVGLMVGRTNKSINKILFALDAVPEVVEEAIKIKADMIITHHPLIFSPVKSITSNTLNGRLYKLIQNDMCVYSAHTNLDITFGGTNDILAYLLMLKNVDVLEFEKEYQGKKYGIGRIGELEEEIKFSDYIENLKKILNLKKINVTGNLDRKIKTVALCTGSGSDYIDAAYRKKADLYISGDIRFHDGQKAQQLNLCLADITHYQSENIAMPFVKSYIESELQKIKKSADLILSKIDGKIFESI